MWIIPPFAIIIPTVKYFVKYLCDISKTVISFNFNFLNKFYKKKLLPIFIF